MTKEDKIILTKRELEVLKGITEGKNNTEIANDMSISVHTVKVFVSSILEKMSVDSRVKAVVKALKEGIIK